MPRSSRILSRKVKLKSAKYTPKFSVPTAFCTCLSIPSIQYGLMSRFKKSRRARLVTNFFCMEGKRSNYTMKKTFNGPCKLQGAVTGDPYPLFSIFADHHDHRGKYQAPVKGQARRNRMVYV